MLLQIGNAGTLTLVGNIKKDMDCDFVFTVFSDDAFLQNTMVPIRIRATASANLGVSSPFDGVDFTADVDMTIPISGEGYDGEEHKPLTLTLGKKTNTQSRIGGDPRPGSFPEFVLIDTNTSGWSAGTYFRSGSTFKVHVHPVIHLHGVLSQDIFAQLTEVLTVAIDLNGMKFLPEVAGVRGASEFMSIINPLVLDDDKAKK